MTNVSGIRPALQAADRGLELEVKKMTTVGHLRRTARDIASNLFGVTDESAEVVALQNSFEKCLNSYVESMRTPTNALSYVAPDAVRALLVSQSPASTADTTPVE